MRGASSADTPTRTWALWTGRRSSWPVTSAWGPSSPSTRVLAGSSRDWPSGAQGSGRPSRSRRACPGRPAARSRANGGGLPERLYRRAGVAAGVPATLAAVKEFLAAGKAEEARTLVTELVKAEPGNAEVLAAFEGLYLAEGVKRATRARDRRRAEILKLPREDRDYRDPPEVGAAFDASVACFDEGLARNPAGGE